MIIDKTNSTNVEIIGDVKEYNTFIDPKNIKYIITLLSSNLYSNPEESFIRETVSNAWDSHIAANTTDIPIIIKYDDIYDSIIIRDFGTGLSPEQFKEIYCSFGNSTKRESNDYIGCFGIGRFACLACSDIVSITSYYNHKKYLYVMEKDNNNIKIYLVNTEDTDDKNGLEIEIKNIKNIDKYVKALKYISFFPNVYVDGFRISKEFNENRIKQYKNFAVSTFDFFSYSKVPILLGNVLYFVNINILTNENNNFITDQCLYAHLTIKFNIGELNVTPNREEIIYNQNSINLINQRIKEVRLELNDLLNKETYDYNDLKDYAFYKRNRVFYDLFTNKAYTYSERLNKFGYLTRLPNVTYKNKVLKPEFTQRLSNIMHYKLPDVKAIQYCSRFYTSNYPYKVENSNEFGAKTIIELSNYSKFTTILKLWLNTKYTNSIIVNPLTKEDFETYLINNLLINKESHQDFLDLCWEYYNEKLIKIDVNNNSEYIKFKKEYNKDKTNNTVTSKNICLHTYPSHYRKETKSFINIQDVLKYLKTQNKGILLVVLDDLNDWWFLAKANNLLLIRVTKKNYDLIMSYHPTSVVDTKSCLNNDIFVNAYTIQKTLPFTVISNIKYKYRNCFQLLNEYELNKFKKVLELSNFYYSNQEFIVLVKRKSDSLNTKINEEIVEQCNILKHYYDIFDSIYNKISKYFTFCEYITPYFILKITLKNKQCRPNYKAYKTIKTDKFLSIL